MNLFEKITGTQILLVLMAAAFLASVTNLYMQASEVAEGTEYIITTAYRENEEVTPPAPAPVDINSATAEELQTLTGIGPAMAQRILDYREKYGPFASVEDLLRVNGRGEATLEKFRGHVTVSVQSEEEPEIQHQPAEEDTAGDGNGNPEPERQEEPICEPEDGRAIDGEKEPGMESGEQEATPALVNLNTATAQELETLNGIGPALAQRILEYRAEHGPFTDVNELLNVKGIGEATLNKFRDQVSVAPRSEKEHQTEETPAEDGETATGGTEEKALVNINTATCEELQTLNGIGPVLAQRIVDYRTVHGPFTSVEELLNVKGIGEKTLNKFREQITVEP